MALHHPQARRATAGPEGPGRPAHGGRRPGSGPVGHYAAGVPAASAPPPLTVITGDEEFLAERALAAIVAGAPGEPDVHDVRAADLRPGELSQLTSPSLFGGGAVVIVRAAQDAGKDVAEELSRYAAAPAADVVVAITHAGGAKGK